MSGIWKVCQVYYAAKYIKYNKNTARIEPPSPTSLFSDNPFKTLVYMVNLHIHSHKEEIYSE